MVKIIVKIALLKLNVADTPKFHKEYLRVWEE